MIEYNLSMGVAEPLSDQVALRAVLAADSGDPVLASDFVFSFKRILSPGLGSEYSYMLYCIKNAEAFNKGHIKDISQVGVKAPDDTTLIISLAKPTP